MHKNITIKCLKSKNKEKKTFMAAKKITHCVYGRKNSSDCTFGLRKLGNQKEEEYFKVLKENNCQPIILYPPKTSFRRASERSSFSDKVKQREFITNIPTLKVLLNNISESERNISRNKL